MSSVANTLSTLEFLSAFSTFCRFTPALSANFDTFFTKDNVKKHIEDGKIDETNFKQILDIYKILAKERGNLQLTFNDDNRNKIWNALRYGSLLQVCNSLSMFRVRYCVSI